MVELNIIYVLNYVLKLFQFVGRVYNDLTKEK